MDEEENWFLSITLLFWYDINLLYIQPLIAITKKANIYIYIEENKWNKYIRNLDGKCFSVVETYCVLRSTINFVGNIDNQGHRVEALYKRSDLMTASIGVYSELSKFPLWMYDGIFGFSIWGLCYSWTKFRQLAKQCHEENWGGCILHWITTTSIPSLRPKSFRTWIRR